MRKDKMHAKIEITQLPVSDLLVGKSYIIFPDLLKEACNSRSTEMILTSRSTSGDLSELIKSPLTVTYTTTQHA